MRRGSEYHIYVIQIDGYETVLYVNYGIDVQKLYKEFLKKHPQIKDSVLRPDLYEYLPPYRNMKKAERMCRKLVWELESKGFDVIASPILVNDYWSLYVIELDGDEKHVYVGMTNYPREKRVQQHIYKFNPARILLKIDNFRLMDELCVDLLIYRQKMAAERAEAELAQDLRQRGYKVKGGH